MSTLPKNSNDNSEASSKDDTGSSLRKFPRVAVYKRARVETQNPHASFSAVVFELGPQGCGLRFDHELDIGNVVKVILYDQMRLDPLILKAQVKWVSNVEGSNLFSCGLQFLAVMEGSTEKSIQEVEEILQETGYRLKCA